MTRHTDAVLEFRTIPPDCPPARFRLQNVSQRMIGILFLHPMRFQNRDFRMSGIDVIENCGNIGWKGWLGMWCGDLPGEIRRRGPFRRRSEKGRASNRYESDSQQLKTIHWHTYLGWQACGITPSVQR